MVNGKHNQLDFKHGDKNMKDMLALMYKLVREGKFEDIAISGGTCLSSIKSFNNVDECIEYIEKNNANELLICKNGKYKFTERLWLRHIKGFKLNEKSVTILTDTMVGVGSRAGYRYNIRF